MLRAACLSFGLLCAVHAACVASDTGTAAAASAPMRLNAPAAPVPPASSTAPRAVGMGRAVAASAVPLSAGMNRGAAVEAQAASAVSLGR
jgi:hypothetical protein